jgi:putative transposase
MPSSFTSLQYHLIFSAKDRLSIITPEMEPRLYEYIGGILRAKGGVLTAAGGMPDHVHLLAGIDKQESIADALRDIKANSSRWVHETFPDKKDFAWQDGYGAFSVSFSDADAVKKYIGGQREHHKKISFQDEFMAFLKRHRIDFDERYVWA